MKHGLLLAIVLAGAAVRIATLDQPIWSDENLALQVLALDPPDMLARIAEAETNPPLYFVVAKAWIVLFGDTDTSLRALSTIFGIATIPVVYAAGVALRSRSAGLIAAALTAASPFLLWYSIEVRPYSLFALLAATSFLCFVHALREGDRRWLWGWAIASGLAIATHYFGVLIFAITAIWLFASRRGERREVALSAGAVGVVCIAFAPLVFDQRDLASWIPLVDLGERLAQIPQHFLFGMAAPWELLVPVATLAVAIALVVGLARIDQESLRAATVAGGVFLAGLGVVVIAVLAGSDLINTRNLIGLWAPFAVLVAIVLAAPEMRRVGPPLAAAVCVLGVGLGYWTATTPETARPDWEQVADAIGPAESGRAIVTRAGLTASLGRYVDGGGRNADPGETVRTSEIDVISLRDVDDYSVGPCWWLGACGGQKMLGEEALPIGIPPEFEPVGRFSTDLYEIERLRAPAPVDLGPVVYGGVLVQEPS